MVRVVSCACAIAMVETLEAKAIVVATTIRDVHLGPAILFS
jgi:hypothetical protein